MKVTFTDRSRIETHQRCPRLRWLEYHEQGIGIAPAKKSLPLCVGGSVHVGLEHLLLGESEDAAVVAALDDFGTHKSALALDTTELAGQAAPTDLTSQLASTALDLGMSPDDPSLVALAQVGRNAAAEYDGWLWQEQAALVEGMVRAWARRRLRTLLEEFEVLEVEREGEWELSRWTDYDERDGIVADSEERTLVFMSRPDALLRSRTDNSLYLLSFKTASTWDVRKARDAEHDMQGLSEGVEVERRLASWWRQIHEPSTYKDALAFNIPTPTYQYLKSLPSPPRILGIRYEYLLKGYRTEDRDLSQRFGLRVWAQRSHLVRAYRGDAGWCWSYEFLKDDGSGSKLYYKSWRPAPVWESMPVREWVDMLDSATPTMSAEDSTVGLEPRLLGYRSDAQATGYTADHPLDVLFPAPLTVYRSDDQLRDWIDQVESQERRVAEGVAVVDAATDDGDRRHALNVHFPMTRRACEYPTTCAMSRVCWGGEDIQRDPLGSGLYRPRTVNHLQELTGSEGEWRKAR